MTRREFSKVSSMAGLGALLSPACSSLNTPGARGVPQLDRRIKWSFAEENPVIKLGQLNPEFDSFRAGAASVVRFGDRYRMYYWGTASGGKGNSICMAESPVDRPNQWRGVGAAILKQPETDYNFDGPSFPCVIQMSERHWLMYFCGWGKKRSEGGIPNRTGLAESFDGGITWKYIPNNPFLALDREYDKAATGSCWVTQMGGELRMYYTAIAKYFPKPEGVQTGHGNRIPLIGIGYMVSSDGYTWTKPLNDFMIRPRLHETEPYNYIVSKPCVVREEHGWRMWVSTFGTAYRIRSLVSEDGLSWRWIESGLDGEFGVGKKGAFDGVQRSYVCVLKHGEGYRCWYTGNSFGRAGMGYATGVLA